MMSAGVVAFAADGDLLALDGRPPKCPDRLGHARLGHLDQREPVGDLDGPDVSPAQARLAGDGADQVLRADAGAAPGADKEPRHAAARPPTGPPTPPVPTASVATALRVAVAPARLA